jgi:hypothetical protein
MIIDSENENQSQATAAQISARQHALQAVIADSVVRTCMILGVPRPSKPARTGRPEGRMDTAWG